MWTRSKLLLISFVLCYCFSDIEPPSVDYCPKDKTIITQKQLTNVSWEEPKFSDNSGDFYKTSNRVPGKMSWGKYEVTYTAIDKSRNWATCRFKINVQRMYRNL